MKRHYKIAVAFILTLFAFGFMQHAAYIERGYFAYGGEWCIWSLPIIYATIAKEKRISKKMKKGIDK